MLKTKDDLYNFLSAICDRKNWQYCGTYGEPGYGDENTAAVILGNYWVNVPQPDGTTRPADIFASRPRLAQRLADLGVEFEWYDEWTIDSDNDKAYRTQGDCYGWTPSYAFTDDGDILTPDDGIDAWVDYAINSTRVALTDRQVPNVEARLVEAGWTRQPDDGDFANGWHPGQNDDPTAITAALRAAHGDIDVVFVITGVGQFDVHFAAFYRPAA